MIRRPKPGDTEDDILQMEKEFLAQRDKNPQMRAAAEAIKVDKEPKKSLFARSREKAQACGGDEELPKISLGGAAEVSKPNELLSDIQEKIVGDVKGDRSKVAFANIVLGDVTEKEFTAEPMVQEEPVQALPVTAFPKVESAHAISPRKGKSIFAQSLEAKATKHLQPSTSTSTFSASSLLTDQSKFSDSSEFMDVNLSPDLSELYGDKSVIVEDRETAAIVHEQNLATLKQMQEEEILAERQKIIDSLNPKLIKLLAHKRQAQVEGGGDTSTKPKKKPSLEEAISYLWDTENPIKNIPNPTQKILQLSDDERWLNFDVVETDKLEWMRDIPTISEKLKSGEKFEARFDWKGVLLPYSLNVPIKSVKDTDKETETETESETETETETVKDERELYLHGAEPARPGYTLQELFRLARANVLQQRISAFGAIAGLLNIYNQGFYDQVLEVPISKIFFLLRFGFDDSQPAQLEMVSKALSFLFYNESDETLLDSMFDNENCQWHPTMPVVSSISDSDDPTSVENLQKQMKQLQLKKQNHPTPFSVNVEESEEDSKTSMTDFQLAETDLIECLLRTNIIRRISFILNNVKPNNSTVTSCFKILIRLARTSYEIADKIAKEPILMDLLETNFLPSLRSVDVEQENPPFYNYPQYLCLKLFRILISHDASLPHELKNKILAVYLQQYLYTNENIRTKLIQVQIECLRILRCFLLQKFVNKILYNDFYPALRQMLHWHYNHNIYEVGVPSLIRQHAAAVLMAITATDDNFGRDVEVQQSMGEPINDCCCSWLYRATRGEGIKEYSQATLLAASLSAIHWTRRNLNDDIHFRNCIKKYLPDFLRSKAFTDCIHNLSKASILLRTSNDRRNLHPPLPNVGAVLMNEYGPQLIITPTYPINLLSVVWKLLEFQEEAGEKTLMEALETTQILVTLGEFLKKLRNDLNRYLATNFFARCELKFIYQLITWDGIRKYLTEMELFQLAYNYLCCLPATNAKEINQLFELYIFNKDYLKVEPETLAKWKETCMVLVKKHIKKSVYLNNQLTLPFTQSPLLPRDWPYFQLTKILKNFLANVQMKPTTVFSEQEVLRMTFSFVGQLENCGMEICSPTEQLMYLMIAFMGPESQFLDLEMQQLLRTNVLQFYARYATHTFDFEAVYPDKCKFENLYALFVDHFQAASYGDEIFSSLVLIPLAQKYDNKWRRRLWSDYANALRFLNCDENLLLGGLDAYLEPIESNPSLIDAYNQAIFRDQVRPGTIVHKIAYSHVRNQMERFRRLLLEAREDLKADGTFP